MIFEIFNSYLSAMNYEYHAPDNFSIRSMIDEYFLDKRND